MVPFGEKESSMPSERTAAMAGAQTVWVKGNETARPSCIEKQVLERKVMM